MIEIANWNRNNVLTILNSLKLSDIKVGTKIYYNPNTKCLSDSTYVKLVELFSKDKEILLSTLYTNPLIYSCFPDNMKLDTDIFNALKSYGIYYYMLLPTVLKNDVYVLIEYLDYLYREIFTRNSLNISHDIVKNVKITINSQCQRIKNAINQEFCLLDLPICSITANMIYVKRIIDIIREKFNIGYHNNRIISF